MKKKGFFFTIAALLLIILLVSLISSRQTYRYREKEEAIYSRVKTMDSFISDFEKDLDRELYIGGYRAIISMTAYLKQIQSYLNDTNLIYSEIFLNGTANGTQMDLMKQETNNFITGADFSSWLQRINQEASKLNIVVFVNVNEIKLEQKEPWNITIILDANLSFNDKKGLVNWNYKKIFERKIPIFGFEDPLYVVATQDKITNIINKTPFEEFVVSKNSDNLEEHYLNSYYIASTKAPSFLMRFSGNLSESQYGIESMVYLPKYFAQFWNYKERSVVDYIYFGNQSLVFYCNITGMPSEFRIDSLHLDDYEINELNYSNC